jgi:hypothetical protein
MICPTTGLRARMVFTELAEIISHQRSDLRTPNAFHLIAIFLKLLRTFALQYLFSVRDLQFGQLFAFGIGLIFEPWFEFRLLGDFLANY